MIKSIQRVIAGGVWGDIDFVYPVKFSNKLNLEFDSGAFNTLQGNYVPSSTVPNADKAYVLIKITTTADEVFYYYTTPNYEWEKTLAQGGFELVEVTKELQGVFLDGVASTNLKGQNKKLFDVVQRLLEITPLRKNGQKQKYRLTTDASVIAKLNKNAPEFRWSPQTSLWEALVDIGACIDAIPRLTAESDDIKCELITFDFINAQKKNSVNSYVGLLNSLDDTQYCNSLETMAENLVSADEEEASIVFPSPNGFTTARTTDVKLTDTNCELHLSKPIADLQKLEIDASELSFVGYNYIYEAESSSYKLVGSSSVTLSSLGYSVLDLTKRMVDITQWQTLDTVQGNTSANTNVGDYKENTLYYNRYSDVIPLQNGSVKVGVSFFSTAVWRLVLARAVSGIFNFFPLAGQTNVSGIDNKYVYGTNGDTKTVLGMPSNNPFTADSVIDIMNAKFRVTYTPLNSVKIRTSKNQRDLFDFVQPYNQRAEINNSVAYGKNMQTTVNRMGVETQTVVDFVTDWEEAKRVGDASGEYVVAAVDYNVLGADAMECVYTLSKDWSYLSQWFNIDKKFRSWNIPAETVSRNLYFADTLRVGIGDSGKASNSLSFAGMREMVYTLRSDDQGSEINNAQIKNIKTNGEQNVVNTSSFGFGKSLVFHAEMLDNVSAGSLRQNSGLYNVDSYYCNDDGTMDNATITFGERLTNIDAYSLPQASDTTNYIAEPLIELNNLRVLKDPAERLGITYQIHAVCENGYHLGSAFFTRNKLTRKRTSWADVRLFGLVDEPADYETMDLLPDTAVDTGKTWSIEVDSHQQVRVVIPPFNSVTEYKGWAIAEVVGDQKYVLLSSEQLSTQEQVVYFELINERGNGTTVVFDTVKFVIASPLGKVNTVVQREYQRGTVISLSSVYEQYIPQHFVFNDAAINGTAVGDTYTVNGDATININLAFVPFVATYKLSNDNDYTRVRVNPIDSTSVLQGKQRLFPFYVKTSDTDNEVVFKDNRRTEIYIPNVSLATRNGQRWQAVVYVTPTYAVGSISKPFFYLIGRPNNTVPYALEINGQNGVTTYAGQAQLNFFQPSTQVDNDICQYRITMDYARVGDGRVTRYRGFIDFEVLPFGTINDVNGGLSDDNTLWQFSYADFAIGEIKQYIDSEIQL